jgi:hypothetical protein
MPASFMNEHTAEYVLVPDLISRLSGTFKTIPFFFWASREGQAKARASYGGAVRLLGAYARRPKVDLPGDETIYVKFNELLFSHASDLWEAGIPLLAGVPCVSRLSDFHMGIQCAWFHIEAGRHLKGADAFAAINLRGQTTAVLDSQAPVRGPLEDGDIISLALKHSRKMIWPEALEELVNIGRNLKRKPYDFRTWYGLHLPYKPFYLALLQN